VSCIAAFDATCIARVSHGCILRWMRDPAAAMADGVC
jgi:hypothetical protein